MSRPNLGQLQTLLRDNLASPDKRTASPPWTKRESLDGEALEKQLGYWKRQLDGAPTLLELPTDRRRPAKQSYRGAAETAVFPSSLLDAVKALSRQEEASLFMTLLAVFQTLLSRYSGQEDIMVGSPIARRNQMELEGLTGLFVNTLVLRGDLSGNPTFRELLQRVKEVTLAAYAHQDLRLEKLVEELQPERNLSYNPLCQVMFALDNMSAVPTQLGGLGLNLGRISSGNFKFDLSVILSEEADGLKAEVTYCTDLYDAATVRRMLGQYQVLLEGIVANPNTHVRQLPLLTEAERHQLLVEWNQTETECPGNSCIHELFEAQVKRTPDAIAVVFKDQKLTYRELNEQSNQLAHQLIGRGIGPEDLVGIALGRSTELIIALLATLKAGAAYLPLDPNYPKDRLAFMLEDAGAAIMLTDITTAEVLPKTASLLCLNSVDERCSRAEQPDRNPTNLCRARTLTPQNLAYVIYTSGSTGTPKGVAIPHANVDRLFKATQNWFQFGPHDTWTMFHSHAFDFSVWEIWGALLFGGRLIVVSYDLTRSPDDFLALLTSERVTVLNQTPSAFYQLMQASRDYGGVLETCALRLVILGGEALDFTRMRQWYEHHPNSVAQLVNMYGITETTVHTTYLPLTKDLVWTSDASLIGTRIADLRVRLLDQYLNPVPIGIAGELYIGGAGLARGYLNRPDLTAERFIADPFGPAGSRIYRTGDLGRFLEDGNIEFLGRIDHQVKIRGFRIELGEIEAVLKLHPSVREAVVVARENVPGDRRLIAYVAPTSVSALAGELAEFLKERLPAYMLPSAYIFVDTFPVTPNGKLDRKALPPPESYSPERDGSYVAPRTLTEQVLADIWCELLNLKQVGIHDNFFELGGHSLLAMRLINEINGRLNVTLGVLEIFQKPTVEQLASSIIRREAINPRPAVVQLRKGSAEPSVYFVFAGPDEFRIAQYISEGIPVFGLEVPWPMAWRNAAANKRTSALPNMDELVAPFLTTLGAHAGSSPCVLVGYSFAGLMAFELAHQFKMQGGNVEMVMLLDSWAKCPPPRQAAWHKLRRDWKWGGKPPLSLNQFLQVITSRLESSCRIIRWMFVQEMKELRSSLKSTVNWQRKPTNLTTLVDEQGELISWELVERLYKNILKSYRPRCLESKGVLFHTEDEKYLRAIDRSLGWKNMFAGGLESISITGDHYSIVRDGRVQILTRAMNEVIEREMGKSIR